MSFIKRHKILSAICAAALLILIVCAIWFSISRINGMLVDYSKAGPGHASYHYGMTEETIKDIDQNPENYKEYYINANIKNITNRTICDVDVNLSGQYQNVWLDKTGLAEWDVSLDPGQEYSAKLYFIINTDNMTEDQVNKQIKGLGIVVSSSDFAGFPLNIIRNAKTIYFADAYK